MLSLLYRGLADVGSSPPPFVTREPRGYPATIAAEAGFGGSIPCPDSYEEFLDAFSDLVAVYRCATLNARAVASAQLRFYDDHDGDLVERVDKFDPLVALFRRPNPRTSGRRWIFQVQLSKELTGNTYEEIARQGKKGRALQLYTLNAAKVEVEASDRGVTGYSYKPGYKPAEHFSADDIWHDTYYDPNSDVYGLPPLRAAKRHVEADRQLEQAMLAMLKNGMRVSGVLHVDADVKAESVNSLKAQLQELHSGVRNWFKSLVVGGGRKFQQLTMTPGEFGASDLRAWNTGMILKAYGVYPIVFGDVDKSATRENATTQTLLYHWHTVEPRATELEEEITQRLIPQLKIPGTERVVAKFDFSQNPLMKQLALDEALAKQALIESGVLNPNEVRGTLDYEPRGGGDEFWSQKQIAPIQAPNGPDGQPEPAKMIAILREAKRIAASVREVSDLREAA